MKRRSIYYTPEYKGKGQERIMAGIKAERRKRGSSGQDAHNYKDIRRHGKIFILN